MGISLDKVSAEAPHLISLVKEAISISLQKGLDLSKVKAAALATIDCSGSTDKLFSSGEMQRVADLAFAAALPFDDDGSMPISYFGSRVHDLGEINLGNCKGFVSRHTSPGGSTRSSDALRWIIDTAGYGHVNLGSSVVGKRFLGFGHKPADKLLVKAKAPYATFAICITDGEPDNNDVEATTDLLFRMSQLPIFVQFIGVGPHKFNYLHKLDGMTGRLIDNAGFFDAKEANGSVTAMLNGLLNEFPNYLKEAKQVGLIG